MFAFKFKTGPMKKLLFSFGIALTSLFTANAQQIIAQWNFNSITPGDINSAVPSAGTGTITLVGGVTTPTSGSSGAGSSDTAGTNLAFQTTTYAPQGTENQQRGIQINLSTQNLKDIKLMFDQRLSNTSSNTYAVQYSLDGTNFTNVQTLSITPTATSGDTWYNGRTVDFSSIEAVNNQPNVRIRIVGAFDPVANSYVAVKEGSTYAGGTVRFDMITITGKSLLSTNETAVQKESEMVYPNPAENIVYFKKPIEGVLIQIDGKVIGEINGTSAQIQHLPKGVYFIKTKTEAYKLIKK